MNDVTKELGDAAALIAVRGAKEYLRANNLTASTPALAECISSWLRIKLPEALRDAKEAMDCGMGQVAQATFAASCIAAGIEAAKEASSPKESHVKPLSISSTSNEAEKMDMTRRVTNFTEFDESACGGVFDGNHNK